MYTSSVANAYFRPFRGLDGAGEGGRLWPSRSTERALPMGLGFPEDEGAEDMVMRGCFD